MPPKEENRSGESGNDSSYNNGCFAETSVSKIMTEDGRVLFKALKDVKVGDKIQSVDPRTSLPTFSDVVFVEHDDDPNPHHKVLKFAFNNNNGREAAIKMTPNHLVYASKSPQSHPTKDPTLACKVQVGDYLWVVEGNKFVPCQIAGISEEVARVINPITKDHHIVVDGVHASTHVQNEKLFRCLTAGFRLLYKVDPRICNSKPLKAVNRLFYKQGVTVVPPPAALQH